MVLAVIPMSLAGAAEPDGVPDAAGEVAVADGLLLLPEELHPAASRTAATSAAISPV
jgi:hypothetical protein